MIISRSIIISHLIAITCLWAVWEYRISSSAKTGMLAGPDVIVGDIPNITRWGTDPDETAFSIGTTSCNIGSSRLDWIQNSTVHPVISQNLYRVKNGRIEQLGMSWLKHGFSVAAGSLCGTCTDTSSTYLAVGCSDPYGSGLNGSQSGLGPKSQVNATTGVFSWPKGSLPSTGILDGRLRVFTSDINPAQNAGARYFAESQYVHPQDAASGNGNNNASYREVAVTTVSGGWGLGFGTPSSVTVRQQPAINAWKAVHADVKLFAVDIPGDGRVIVGMRTTPLPAGGGYHTEFAIENLNSDRSVRSLAVNYGSSAISNPGFRDVDYQFEAYSNTDWTPNIVGPKIEWSTPTFGTNPNANALRWNSLYSFWCDSELPPRKLTLGMFKPGVVAEMNIDLVAPLLPVSYALKGVGTSGSFADMFLSDNQYFRLTLATKSASPAVELVLNSTSSTASPTDFAFKLEATMAGGQFGEITQMIEMRNFVTGLYEVVDVRLAEIADQTLEITPTGVLSRFVQNGTKAVQARVVWSRGGITGSRFSWSIAVDEAVWLIGQ